jgi:hypothetical protein
VTIMGSRSHFLLLKNLALSSWIIISFLSVHMYSFFIKHYDSCSPSLHVEGHPADSHLEDEHSNPQSTLNTIDWSCAREWSGGRRIGA